MNEKREPTPEEIRRLERMEQVQRNRRARRQPSVMPSDLARTSAFVPRRRGLNEDRNFSRIYEVPGHSVIEITGRELGSQHRDALYALFRCRARPIQLPNSLYPQGGSLAGMRPYDVVYETMTTWRELLQMMGLTIHVNNLLTLLKTFEDIRSVTFRVFSGEQDQYFIAKRANRLVGAGFSDNLLNLIEWDGVTLDSQVRIRYGEWVKKMFEIKHLISLNADVYFSLKSDHAKTFWPYIDSMTDKRHIDEEKLAELSSRDVANESPQRRRKFREDCRQAFDDMVRAGGLKEWRVEVTGDGKRKGRRYHYVPALARQGDAPSAGTEGEPAALAPR